MPFTRLFHALFTHLTGPGGNEGIRKVAASPAQLSHLRKSRERSFIVKVLLTKLPEPFDRNKESCFHKASEKNSSHRNFIWKSGNSLAVGNECFS